MKQTDYKGSVNNTEFKEYPSLYKKNQFYSNHLQNIIRSLSSPRFLGSIHMKSTNSNNNSIEHLIESEMKLKTTKALKNTLFNPLTKILIILAIAFNIIWFLLAIIL